MSTINGIPAHPLFVHLAVVAIPLAALLGIIAAVWPAALRRLGPVAPLVALVAVVITPLTTSAGEALERSTPPNPTLEQHTHLGDQMIYWVAPLFAAITLLWLCVHPAVIQRTSRWSPGVRSAIRVALSVLVVVFAVGSLIWVYRIGESGAASVWLHP